VSDRVLSELQSGIPLDQVEDTFNKLITQYSNELRSGILKELNVTDAQLQTITQRVIESNPEDVQFATIIQKFVTLVSKTNAEMLKLYVPPSFTADDLLRLLHSLHDRKTKLFKSALEKLESRQGPLSEKQANVIEAALGKEIQKILIEFSISGKEFLGAISKFGDEPEVAEIQEKMEKEEQAFLQKLEKLGSK